jgi:hypothetical protein
MKKLKQPKATFLSLRRPDESWVRNDEEKATNFAEHLAGVSLFNRYEEFSEYENEA